VAGDERRRRLVFASRSAGKLVELQALTSDLGLDVVSVAELAGIADVVEDGETFGANATKKAIEVSRATGLPALADDSGLEVDALGGEPGVYSARYAGMHGDDEANNRKLNERLAGVPPERRGGRFRCVLALADVAGALGDRVITVEGACEGRILDAPRGKGGFGYDPLFFAPELGMTFAEAGIGPKSGLSHRARAMRALRPELAAYFAVASGAG
jgi:XTP/dITP diphosphohydrolase